MSTDLEDRFEFTLVAHYNPLQDIETKSRETIELFEKWGMSSRMKSHTFFFNKFFQPYQREAFAKDFFASSVVSSTLQVLTPLEQWVSLNMDKVTVEQVNASIINMDFFDRLYTSGAVRESSGSIVKCFDEMIDEFLVSDELRKVVLGDPVYESLYSTEERNEFLFKIFAHIVLGGPVNQYEDNVKPYLDTAKLLYKSLVSVVKDTETSSLSISSTVLKVGAKVGGIKMFPSSREHPQSFCYLVIDNIKRHVTVWYHIWS
ncbi:PREDICTED: uncharacterized protein C11orf70 homolog isoform X2 [Amphimedon queenslandica]|uniref:Cilia- and flagella-associated protein 300 n=1 Tax=Amphimedon queenslandica TaxID=400682 RepID=A0AAN0JCV4_AMPQE|nr:PREDICTED: uncharacterized protein C11orf70 homolog isoform X2 [Amphimedon queenslandica]|eukprot:XP_019854814.1 PREDICTED: uncharacterized protein C11orf70 homolog isoform X2 [Amphimedon queenslandica]